MDIVARDFCLPFRFRVISYLFIRSSMIIRKGGGIVILASWKNYYIRATKKLLQYPSNSISITIAKRLVYSRICNSRFLIRGIIAKNIRIKSRKAALKLLLSNQIFFVRLPIFSLHYIHRYKIRKPARN